MIKCSDYNAGMLKTAVTFQRLARTSDGAGGWSEAWAAITGAPERAHVKALSGGERWASDRVEASARFRVTARYFAGLTEADRVLIGGRAHNITFINNVEFADRWHVLDVTGGVAS